MQAQAQANVIRTWTLTERSEALVRGMSVGAQIASGEVCRLEEPEQIEDFVDGGVLVARRTDPDWVPVMRRASAIVTDEGGRTSHAAIVSRELGVPALVGCGDATRVLRDGDEVTVSCAEGDEGVVFRGRLPIEEDVVEVGVMPEISVPLMMNIATPSAALQWWRLPVKGVGLLRLEHIIGQAIKVHPIACVQYADLPAQTRAAVDAVSTGYEDKEAYFVETLAEGIATIAAVHTPHRVVVRLSDFKTNEFAHLIGGALYEPEEANPMLGWRGASRYDHEAYREGFALECRAIKKVRDEVGLTNVAVMVPFCRTLDEADEVLAAMARHGLVRGEDGLQVWVMAELPSNIWSAPEFAERFDGFSIGSNDLTQLTLGIDRDNARLSDLFDERDPAVRRAIAHLVEQAHAHDTPVGICGQAPSDHPDFAAWLRDIGIDSISLTPDRVVETWLRLAGREDV